MVPDPQSLPRAIIHATMATHNFTAALASLGIEIVDDESDTDLECWAEVDTELED